MNLRSLPVVLRVRRGAAVLGELAIAVATNWFAFQLRFDGHTPGWAWHAWLQMLPWLVVVRGLAFKPFGVYSGIWRYTSVYDLANIVQAVAVSSGAFLALAISPIGPPVYPRSVFVVDAIILTLVLCSVRIARRLHAEFAARAHAQEHRSSRRGKRLLIIGAGDAGEMIAYEMRAKAEYEYDPVGFIDDDPSKKGLRIHGVPVLGSIPELSRILEEVGPDEVLIAIPSADAHVLRGIVRLLEGHKVVIKTLPSLRELINGSVGIREIRSLAFEDLLARAPIGLDPAPLHSLIRGRRVLVTGAGGSIGGELCRQIASMAPASLVMLDRYENGLHGIFVELSDRRVGGQLQAIIADITDEARMRMVFEQHRPQIVFHAAAHKHVPLMEGNPCEAIKNNVTGTRLVAELAEDCGVERFILISTDKAVHPVNAMGASKRLAELILRARSARTRTAFATVRFGNVLGSSGSVVPRFLEQIRAGGPVTVTHPEVRRFFMLIPEAVQLVLHAAAQAERGATYVLEMGDQVKLLDMARHLIRLSGAVPDEDIKIEFTGLRPGEKLSEQLVGERESVRPSKVSKVLRVIGDPAPGAEAQRLIAAIEARAHANDGAGVTGLLPHVFAGYPAAASASIPGDQPVHTPAMPVPAHVRAAFISPNENCPSCGTAGLRRTKPRTVLERAMRSIGNRRLFTCPGCSWRGWLLPIEAHTAPHGGVANEPNLSEADALIAALPQFHPSNPTPLALH